jgi:hypothetical protein
MDLNEFAACLDNAVVDRIPDVAADLLLRAEDWAAMVREYIQQLRGDEFCALVLRAHIAHVEPRIFMIHENPGRYQVILHHFDRPAFDRHWHAGRLGPHYHHFPFTTRLLRGRYYNWIYDNEGDLLDPKLRLASQVLCDQGDIYTLPFDRFHCVLLPEQDTLSLMVRGRAVFDPGHLPDAEYGERTILEARKRLLELLAEKAYCQQGRFLDLRRLPINGGEPPNPAVAEHAGQAVAAASEVKNCPGQSQPVGQSPL